jgi:hypothetical protein
MELLAIVRVIIIMMTIINFVFNAKGYAMNVVSYQLTAHFVTQEMDML